MEDKEIIIDGVDVSKCEHFLKDTEGQDYNTDEFVKGCCEAKGCYIGSEFIGYSICKGDKNCYFKQLSRKTTECKKYEQALDDVREYICNNTDFDISDAIQNKTAGYDILQIIKGV